MKIYVACHERELAHSTAEVLSASGHEITSRWHNKAFHPMDFHSEVEREQIAQEDFDDISAADSLVLIAGPEKYSGGKFVEAGIALGMGKRVLVIGRRENMLLWLPQVVAVSAARDAARTLLTELKETPTNGK